MAGGGRGGVDGQGAGGGAGGGAEGARVARSDVDAASRERGAGGVREIGGDDAVLPIVGDISAWDDAQRAVRETIDGLGGLHVLINHAGINARYAGLPESEHPPFWELPPEVWRRVGDVNVNGPFLTVRAAVGPNRFGRLQTVVQLRQIDVRVRIVYQGIEVFHSFPGHHLFAVELEKLRLFFTHEVVGLVGMVEAVKFAHRIALRMVVIAVGVFILFSIRRFAFFRLADDPKIFPVLHAGQGRMVLRGMFALLRHG